MSGHVASMAAMPWMRLPGQGWPAAAAAFVGMWVVMTVAMMLPAVAPTLWRHGHAVAGADASRAGPAIARTAAGWLAVWAVVGAAVYPVGAAAAALTMAHPALARGAPLAAGVVVLLAGACQHTPWKARALAACRAPGPGAPHAAWRDGVRVGLHCVRACANWTAVLLALGVMDGRAMALVGAAVTAERLVPDGARTARALGAVAVGGGAWMIARAAGAA